MAMIRPWFLLGAVLAAPSALAQTAGTVALDNDYVRVSKDARLQNEELRRYQNKKDESDEHLPNGRHPR